MMVPELDAVFQTAWEANGGRAQSVGFMSSILHELHTGGWLARKAYPVVADVGCALGDGTVLLRQRFPYARVIGQDVCPTAIQKAHASYPNIDFVLTELDGPFTFTANLMTCSNTLEHVPNWLETMTRWMTYCTEMFVALVPYNQQTINEWMGGTIHYHRFVESSFPPFVGDFRKDLSLPIDVPTHCWQEKQLLVVYRTRRPR